MGICERAKIIDGSKIAEGDVLLGLPSSGLHSNGFSLARKALLGSGRYTIHELIPELGKTLAEELLTPTRIYVKPVLELLRAGMEVHAIAHITGGGFYDNIERLLPPTLDASVAIAGWNPHPIFGLIMREGEVALDEMYRTFNMGIGMALIVPPAEVDGIGRLLAPFRLTPILLGELRQGSGKTILVGV